MGDGLLAEFASVVDAVECAVDIQRGMAERNAGLPEDQRIDVRIGVNLGEVIVEGTDRHGEGVNIAARLQQLAEAGGICVSGKVANEVEKKLAFGFEPMGAQRVKNISEPIPVYRIKLDGVRAPAKRKPAKYALTDWARPLAAAMFLLAGLAAAGWYGFVRSSTHQVTAVAATHMPSIAVLPFDDHEPRQEPRLSRRRGQRGHHHHVVALSRSLGDRAQLVLCLQGQAGRHPPGRPRPQRRLCAGRQRPQGRRSDSDHRPTYRHPDGQAHLGRALRQDRKRSAGAAGRGDRENRQRDDGREGPGQTGPVSRSLGQGRRRPRRIRLLSSRSRSSS